MGRPSAAPSRAIRPGMAVGWWCEADYGWSIGRVFPVDGDELVVLLIRRRKTRPAPQPMPAVTHVMSGNNHRAAQGDSDQPQVSQTRCANRVLPQHRLRENPGSPSSTSTGPIPGSPSAAPTVTSTKSRSSRPASSGLRPRAGFAKASQTHQRETARYCSLSRRGGSSPSRSATSPLSGTRSRKSPTLGSGRTTGDTPTQTGSPTTARSSSRQSSGPASRRLAW